MDRSNIHAKLSEVFLLKPFELPKSTDNSQIGWLLSLLLLLFLVLLLLYCLSLQFASAQGVPATWAPFTPEAVCSPD